MSCERPVRSTPGRLAAVVPVHPRDRERLGDLLLPSLRSNLIGLDSLTIVVPDNAVADLSASLRLEDNERIVPDSLIVPGLEATKTRLGRGLLRTSARANAVGRRLRFTSAVRRPDYIQHGWFRQQLVKLAFAFHTDSDAYLSLDADVVCTRNTRVEELLPEGKPLIDEYERVPPSQQNWYDWAAALLQVPVVSRGCGVTPFLYHSATVREMTMDIVHQSHHGGALLRRMFPRLSGPAELVWALPWAEMPLYYSWLVARDRLDNVHTRNSDLALIGASYWNRSELEGPASNLRTSREHVFQVIQSTLGLPIDETRVLLGRQTDPRGPKNQSQ